jgi:peroxiredoxin
MQRASPIEQQRGAGNMNPFENGPTIGPGDPAPDFHVQWIEGEGSVSLADFRGRAVLIALVRGLWCPFCRRALASLGSASDGLGERGVATLGIVATAPDNARLYLRYRPSRIPLAADPEMATHATYGLPRPTPTPELFEAVAQVRTDAGGELPQLLPFPAASEALNRIDGYEGTRADEDEQQRAMTQLAGHFMIDRDGIVRWTDIECVRDGLAGLGKHPRPDELLAAASVLV